jgi:hypothetical protein
MARLLAALFSVILFGVEASARTETLRWSQVEPPAVAGFHVHWRVGTAAGPTEDVGLPPKDAQGVRSVSIIVDDAVDVYFTMTAYDSNGASSFPSNEICRGPGVPCGSGGSTPPPTGGDTGGTAQAAITGFKLWNASNDTVIDSSFQSGESILTSQYPCVAIEIVGNAYLNDGASGSVKKQLDATGGSCTTPGVTHENSAPFAWEADEGPGKFACASSLQQAGTHTLTVTPYDGDDCTGAAGATLTLLFQTNAPLGAPGQPFLVTP